MPPIRNWFKSKKPLRTSRLAYYEDVFGEKNPEEDLEGVHIIDTDSDSDPGVFSRRARRHPREKPRITLRQSNKDQSDGRNKMGTADGNEVVALRVDRSTGTKTAEPKSHHGMLADERFVVTIDDDASDVEEQFVVDLRKHAQGPDNKNNEGDIEGPESNQEEIDTAFLAEVKKYAASPPPIGDESNDELLKRINRRAESFANQSPLGRRQGLEPEPDAATVLPSIEQTHGTNARERFDEPIDTPSVKVLDDAMSTRIVDGVVVSDTSGPSITAVRDHSWDPSQGSDYVYSDEEAVDGLENMNYPKQDLHDDSFDSGDEDKESQTDDTATNKSGDDEHVEEHLVDGVQREMSNGTAEVVSMHGSSSVDNDNQEVIDLTSPTQSSSEEPALRRTGFSRRSTHGSRDHGPSTSLEPVGALTRTRKRRFGLFGSKSSPSIEPEIDELSDDTPPRRLRDLVLKRRREREERGVANKRPRYNLRPRGHSKSYFPSKDIASTVDELNSETDDEAEEHQASRRVTRSMTTRTSGKKPVPRFRAARKSAWPLVPKDDTSTSRKESSRQVVQVIVPKIVDRSTWSSTCSPRIERSPSAALNGGPVTMDGEQKMEPALAGKGIKRGIPFVLIE